jgi:hypothetical protein
MRVCDASVVIKEATALHNIYFNNRSEDCLQFFLRRLRFDHKQGYMKRSGSILALFIFLGSYTHAQDYKMSLGLRASSNDAIVNHAVSFKYFFNPTIALEGLLSFTDPLAIGALIQKHHPMKVQGLTWFYGGGAYLAFGSDQRFGLQGVLGLDYKVPAIPLNLAVDWKPEMNITKEFLFEPAVIGVSARFILK